MNLIVAADKNNAIGNNGQLLCYIKPDLEYFKRMTLNKTVIMGRKTLESLPGSKPLKNRNNIVLTRDRSFKCADAVICYSIDDVLSAIKDIPQEDVFVIGGQSIYEQLLPFCTGAYITRIDKEFEADTFIPDFDTLPDWKLCEAGEWQEFNEIRFSFTVYKRG